MDLQARRNRVIRASLRGTVERFGSPKARLRVKMWVIDERTFTIWKFKKL